VEVPGWFGFLVVGHFDQEKPGFFGKAGLLNRKLTNTRTSHYEKRGQPSAKKNEAEPLGVDLVRFSQPVRANYPSV